MTTSNSRLPYRTSTIPVKRRIRLILLLSPIISILLTAVAVYFLYHLFPALFYLADEALGEILRKDSWAEGSDTVYYQALFLMVSVTLSLAGTICVSTFVYALVTYNQEKATETSLEMERLQLLHELEDDFEAISMRPALVVKRKAGEIEPGILPFRLSMTHRVEWQYFGRSEEITKEGKRTTPLSKEANFMIDSDTLHIVQLWFRRAYRAYRAEVIRTTDLYVIWRLILPFAVQGRLEFFGRYFGPAKDIPSRDDIMEMEFLMTELLHHILEARSEESSAVHYLRKNGPVDARLLDDPKLIKHPRRSLIIPLPLADS